MKKLPFLFFFISIFGYAQTITLPSTQDRFPQEILDRMNPNALTSQVDEFSDMNQIKNVQSQTFQREMLVQDENYNLRLDRKIYMTHSGSDLEYKYEYTYNANGSPTLFIRYNWDTDSTSFVPSYKYEYTYDANGNRTLLMRYNWDTDSQSFVPSNKYESTYDANGNITLYINYNWDTDSQSFVPSNKYEYTYDANGNQTLFIRYNWDTDSTSLVPYIKIEYYYDANGNITLFIASNWDTDSQSFVPDTKYEYAYDANNFTTNETTYYWYPQFGFYKPSFRTDISIQSETDTNLVREGINYEYDTNFNTWNELEGEEFKSYWYYTKESSLSTDIVELNSFTIYPNPTNNTLFISGSESPLTISIYNMLGKEVLSINNTDNINVQALPKGIYAIRISDGVNQTNKKFIKN